MSMVETREKKIVPVMYSTQRFVALTFFASPSPGEPKKPAAAPFFSPGRYQLWVAMITGSVYTWTSGVDRPTSMVNKLVEMQIAKLDWQCRVIQKTVDVCTANE